MSVNPNESNEGTPEGQAPPPEQKDYSNIALYQKAKGQWDKANESYFNAVKELGSVHEQLKAEQQQRVQLEAMVAAAMGRGPTDNQSPFAGLETLGVSPDAVDSVIERKVQAQLQAQMETLFSPIVNQIQAEEQLASEIEDFDQHKSAARAFMKQNSEVGDAFKALVQTNPVQAWKYAIRETVIANQSQPTRKLPPGLPGSRAGTAPRQQVEFDAAAQRERENEGLKLIQSHGDTRAYRHERFKGNTVEMAIRDQYARLGLPYPGDNQ
jgi:hypothetical protein